MKDPTPKEIARTIMFFYWIMFLSAFAAMAFVSVFVSSNGPVLETKADAEYPIFIVLVLVLIMLAPVSYLIPQKMVRGIDKTLPLFNKMSIYRTALFIRFFIMDAAAMIIAAGFLLTGNQSMVYLLVILLLFFIIYKPSIFRIASDLELDVREKEMLE